MKTAKINEDTWQKLMQLKIQLKKRTLSDTIDVLLSERKKNKQ